MRGEGEGEEGEEGEGKEGEEGEGRKGKIGSRVRDRMKRRKGMGEMHREVQRKGQKGLHFSLQVPLVAHICPEHCHILQCSPLTGSRFTV